MYSIFYRNMEELERFLRERQLELWKRVQETYEISPTINDRVHGWIQAGVFSEKASKLSRPMR